MNKILNLGDINVNLYSDGRVEGFKTKRLATIEETRDIFYNIFKRKRNNMRARIK